MTPHIDDTRIAELRPLISPAVLMNEVPADKGVAEFVSHSRRQAERILSGDDDRLMVVVGPCSIHDPEAALDYADRLARLAEQVKDELFLVMRVYFEKPRTTVGWKGLINDPHLDETFDINEGLYRARKLLLDLAQRNVPAGTEFLDAISPQFMADLVTWGAIGARTTESQVHRELASGLSCPVGFKNGTGGSIQIALDALQSSRCPHRFLSVTKQGVAAIVATKGNPFTHVILRGSKTGTNYDAESIADVAAMLKEAGLPQAIMVDCSHGNSRKKHENQVLVANDLAGQIAGGTSTIVALMIESHLKAGNQSLGDTCNLEYGVSVTDPCIDWPCSVEILASLAEAVRNRRALKNHA